VGQGPPVDGDLASGLCLQVGHLLQHLMFQIWKKGEKGSLLELE
jgi:hypothetical protein